MTNDLYCNNCFLKQKQIVKILEHCGKYLKNLFITPNGEFDSKIMPVIGEYCMNLVTIELWLRNYHEIDFLNVFQHMKKLKTVKIFGYVSDNNEDTDEFDGNENNKTTFMDNITTNLEKLTVESYLHGKLMPKHLAEVIFLFMTKTVH